MTLFLDYIPLPEKVYDPKYVFAMLRVDGSSPVGEFFGEISANDRDVFYDRMRVLAETGRDRMNPSSFKRLKGKKYRDIYELKTGFGSRIACFFDEMTCILAVGWKKESNQARANDKRHYDRAVDLRELYLSTKGRQQ